MRPLTDRNGGNDAIGKRVDRRDGIKTIVKGEMRRADGTVTVTGEGIFILPRWAREELAESGGTPPQYE